MPRILVVDDEIDLLELVSSNLERQGFQVEKATDGLAGLELATRLTPDLIVLDWMLPGMDGLQVYKRLRKDSRTRFIPVLMLSARDRQADIITGLEQGLDDYVTKPFSPKELVLRVTNLLRRGGRVRHVSELKVDEFVLDLKNLKLFCSGELIELTTTEFKLMTIFLENVGKVHLRADLLNSVWGYLDDVHTRTLDTHVKRLREKLGDSGKRIRTVRGMGYAFAEIDALEGEISSRVYNLD